MMSKSVVVKKFGGYEALSVEEFPLGPLDDNVEVKVEYGGLNFADVYTRLGMIPKDEFPFVLGIECSGIVTNPPKDSDNLKVGQKVVCYNYNGGLFRKKVHVSPKHCFPLPDNFSLEIGAAFFVNYLTAYFSLFDIGNLKEHESILILSCTGGVGCAAVQLARTVNNVKIFGTGSRHKEEQAKNLQIDTFFPNETFGDEIKNCDEKFDIILTNQSGKILDFLCELLKPLGRIVILGANNFVQNESSLTFLDIVANVPLERLIVKNQIVAGLHLGTLLETDPEKVRRTLNILYELIENDQIKPVIHSIFLMDDIVEATKVLAERKNVGKVLIRME